MTDQTTEQPAPAPPASPLLSPAQAMLERARDEVAAHTRYSREDVALVLDKNVPVPIEIETIATLSTRVASAGINKNFVPNSADIESEAREKGAEADVPRLRSAGFSKLVAQASKDSLPYDEIKSGFYLADRRHWKQ